MHQKRIGIQNFRVFKDYTDFEFAPITILTGKNNAGKSSLIKLLMLMDESANKHNLQTLEFDGKAGLKSFGNCIPWTSDDKKSITYTSHFKLKYSEDEYSISYRYIHNRAESSTAGLSSIKIYNSTLDKLIFKFIPNHHITEHEVMSHFYFDFVNLFNEMKNNMTNVIKEREKLLQDFFDNFGKSTYQQALEDDSDSVFKQFSEERRVELDDKTEKHFNELSSNISSELLKNEFDIYEELNMLYLDYSLDKRLHHHLEACAIKCFGEVENFDIKNRFENNEFVVFHKLLNVFFDLIVSCHSNVTKNVANWNKISPLRGSADRVYSNKSESSAIFEIAKKFSENFGAHTYGHVSITEFINRQLRLFEIDGELEIERIEGVATTFYVKKKDGSKVLLADLGFGYSQLIPIILEICNMALSNNDKGIFWPSKFIVEEPEANLHPDFQSKLIDMFIDAGKCFNMQFVIETHSEYLIRKLQLLTLQGEVKPKDSVIYYFNNPERLEEGEKQVVKIRVTKNGGLTESFGKGFFDEASNIQFDILRLSRAQNN